ncbi:MAG: hypothetical protein GY801_15100 [bacterium]|nr:hypothetical protein [bacterium]
MKKLLLGIDIGTTGTKTVLFDIEGNLQALGQHEYAIQHLHPGWAEQYPGYLLITVAAVFIGGTSIYGGEGTIFGTVFGAFIVGSITAGITASGVGGFWSELVVGLVMLAAILTNIIAGKHAEKTG